MATLVRVLAYLPASSASPERRVELLRPLFDSGLRLVLYLDDHYRRLLDPALVPPSVTLVPFRLDDTDTARQVAAAGSPALPDARSPTKDTLPFLTLTNAKPELVDRAVRDGFVTTPHAGFIDAGIAKVFADPAGSFARIRAADLAGLANVLVPGRQEPWPVALGDLLDRVWWVFCGGLFLLPAARAGEFFRRSHETQGEFLRHGRYTWEVNVWALLAGRDPTLFRWFAANHDDRTSALPDVAALPPRSR